MHQSTHVASYYHYNELLKQKRILSAYLTETLDPRICSAQHNTRIAHPKKENWESDKTFK